MWNRPLEVRIQSFTHYLSALCFSAACSMAECNECALSGSTPNCEACMDGYGSKKDKTACLGKLVLDKYSLAHSWRYSMPSVEHSYRWFRAKNQNNETSNTELEQLELTCSLNYILMYLKHT